MKNILCIIALIASVSALADTYMTIRHAQISPTNRVVLSIPTWAQSPNPPDSGVDTNTVNGLIARYDTTNITGRINEKQNTLTAGTNITITNDVISSTATSLVDDVKTNGVSAVANKVANITIPDISGKQDKIDDYTTTNAVCDLITNNVADWAMHGKPEPSGSVIDIRTNNVSIVSNKVADIYNPVKRISETVLDNWSTNSSSEFKGVSASAKNALKSLESAELDSQGLLLISETLSGKRRWKQHCVTNTPVNEWMAFLSDVVAATNALPAWTKTENKPTYTASEVGALPANAVIEKISKSGYSIYGDMSVYTNGVSSWVPSSSIPASWEGVYFFETDPVGTILYVTPRGVACAQYDGNVATANELTYVSGDPTYAPFPQKFTKVESYYSGRLALNNDIPDISGLAPKSMISATNATFSNATYSVAANSDNLWNASNAKLTATIDGKVSPMAASVASVSNRQDTLEGYIAGQRVRVSVTNYYGNTSGQLPRLRIEEFVTATNVTGGIATETNYWQTVWDEQDKYETFLSQSKAAIAAMTNNLYQTYYALLMERLNTKAPRAWGTLTSAGEAAPVGSVWHTEPNTVFAGGTEYAHAMVGTGVIGVLTTRGAAVYTDGETGRFHFTTDDKQYYFGMNIATRYELGCATDGITVTTVGGNKMVELLYNVTMTGKPILYYTTSLSGNIVWEQITDSSGGAIPGATVYATWDQAPPAGSEICTINAGQGVSGFFKASVEYAGSSKFETNMMADFKGGIISTNQTTNQMQPVEPYISNGSVLWRIKQ